MKNVLFFVMLLSVLFGCTPTKNFNCVLPLPSGLDVESLTDCTVPARFTVDDFNWMGGNLSLVAYNEDIYDALQLNQMEVGDTVYYDGRKIKVETIENKDGVITVNGGLDQGGCWFQAYEGGTYRAFQFDDHSLYSELGKAVLPLADNFMIIDCGENFDDPSDTVRTNQKLYLEQLKNHKCEFNELNTKVVVEKGVITEIERRWIP